MLKSSASDRICLDPHCGFLLGPYPDPPVRRLVEETKICYDRAADQILKEKNMRQIFFLILLFKGNNLYLYTSSNFFFFLSTS
jgi:hypothetical protein